VHVFFLSDLLNKKLTLPKPGQALAGRTTSIHTAASHHVSGRPLKGPFPDSAEIALFGMGCFWGAERLFWRQPGVWVTAVGFAGGETPNPTYQETCTGLTGHCEVVRVVFGPERISYEALLTLFWENHDPTQGMRQGNDIGTAYRSALYTSSDAQLDLALASRAVYAAALRHAGRGKITTEIQSAPPFYFAESDHQQYLSKNPSGYCALRGTGVALSLQDAEPAPKRRAAGAG